MPAGTVLPDGTIVSAEPLVNPTPQSAPPPQSTQPAPSQPPPSQQAATAEAVERHVGLDAIMSRASAENFPVALRLLPREVQSHLRAIYGYARLVDNLGDDIRGTAWPPSTGSRLSLTVCSLDLGVKRSSTGWPPRWRDSGWTAGPSTSC